jgi:hypothetical protein
MDSFLFESILPGEDMSTKLMSSGVSKQDVIRFDRLMRGSGNDGVRILDEPKNTDRQANPSQAMSVEALDKLEQIQLSTQGHIRQVMEIVENQSHFNHFGKKLLKKNHWEFLAKLRQDMHGQAGKLLKAQLHMNLFTVTITIANKVASNVNEGIKTLYRQQG